MIYIEKIKLVINKFGILAALLLVENTTFAGVITPENELVAGGGFYCTLTDDHDLTCWGFKPRAIQIFPPTSGYFKNPRDLSANENGVCAVTDTDNISCWSSEIIGCPNGLICKKIFAFNDLKPCVLSTSGLTCQDNERWSDEQQRHVNVKTPIPQEMSALTGVTHLTNSRGVPNYPFMAALASGNVYFWTYEPHELTLARQPQALAAESGEKFKEIAAGSDRFCALSDRSLRCVKGWDHQELTISLNHPKSFSVGENHTCAVSDDGVQCFGDDNTREQLNVPTDLKNPTRLASDMFETCALTDEGLRCWGKNWTRIETPIPPPSNVPNYLIRIRAAFANIASYTYKERRDFLLAVQTLVPEKFTESQTFFFFALQTFWRSLDSDWGHENIDPDIPRALKRIKAAYGKEALSDFAKSPEYLKWTFQILSQALTATSSSLTIASQRELETHVLPVLAEKITSDELTVRDGIDVAAVFSANQSVLREMRAVARLGPFAKMIDELVSWLSGPNP